MTALATLAFLAVLFSYGAATLIHAREFLREEKASEERHAILARNVGLTCHIIFLVILGVKYEELPLAGIANFLTFLALALVIVHSVVEARSSVRGTGVFILGIATFLHLISWPAIKLQPEIEEVLRSPLFGIHVLCVIVGYTAFILSALYGVLYLVQFRALKAMRFGPFFRNLPALEHLARMNFDGALVGLITLGISILAGLLLAYRIDEPVISDPKFLQAVLVWVLYAILAFGRFKFGWSGRFLVHLSLACFGLFVGSMLAVMVFFQTFHSFS